MISNVFSPRGVLLAFLVVIFSACSAAASDARLLHGGATRSLQEASLDGDNDVPGARRVLLKKERGERGGNGKHNGGNHKDRGGNHKDRGGNHNKKKHKKNGHNGHDNGKNKKKKFGGFSRGNGFGGKKNGNGLGKKNGNGWGR